MLWELRFRVKVVWEGMVEVLCGLGGRREDLSYVCLGESYCSLGRGGRLGEG